jgi:hypothetical protein
MATIARRRNMVNETRKVGRIETEPDTWELRMRTLKATALAAATAFALSSAPANATGSLFFIIDGDTFSQPYSITNNSDAGETVVGFGITLIAPFGFDTVNGGFGFDNSTAFVPVGGSDVTTGYTGPGAFADGATSIAFTFNDFDAGESFIWNIDVDSPSTATIFGNELIGSAVYVDFSNGLRGSGFLEAVPGNDDAAQFVIRVFSPTPAIPEPATWGMMIAGLGTAGYAMRRARAKVAFA